MGKIDPLSRIELLERCMAGAKHNLLCYSKTCDMTEPKECFETQWEMYKAECELLDEVIRELKTNEAADRVGIHGWRLPEVLEEKKPLQVQDYEEARRYVEDVLVGEKGLRLVDVAKLLSTYRTTLSKFLRGHKDDWSTLWLTLQILAIKERLEGSVAVDE